ncbi:MAG: GIN domain-containing protein [Massilia sp.]
MKQFYIAGLALFLAAGNASSAAPADDRDGQRAEKASDKAPAVTETRPIDARVVRVHLDGMIDLTIRQGAVAQLVLTGEQKAIVRTTTEQSGDTIVIDNDEHVRKSDRDGKVSFGFHRSRALRAELILPRLRELRSDSLGKTEVSGFNGDELDLALEGAGAMKVVADYRIINASLGGIGSMNIQTGNSERIDLNLHGAGYVTLIGRTRLLKASLGGLGGLDAEKFQADAVNIDMSGLGNASVLARQSAVLNLSGMGSVTVYGKPEKRSVSVDGLGKVSWK